MRGYHSSSYGDAFADVYDDWYRDLGDIETTVVVPRDAGTAAARVLELGVGTGRLAVPLRRSVAVGDGHRQQPEDARPPCVERSTPDRHGRAGRHGRRPPRRAVRRGRRRLQHASSTCSTAERQQACFDAVAAAHSPTTVRSSSRRSCPQAPTTRLAGVGPLADDRPGRAERQRAPTPATSAAEGQFVELTEAGGVRLRPWSIRWADPDELDAHGRAQWSPVLHERWADYDRSQLRRRQRAPRQRVSTVITTSSAGMKSATRPYIARSCALRCELL